MIAPLKSSQHIAKGIWSQNSLYRSMLRNINLTCKARDDPGVLFQSHVKGTQQSCSEGSLSKAGLPSAPGSVACGPERGSTYGCGRLLSWVMRKLQENYYGTLRNTNMSSSDVWGDIPPNGYAPVSTLKGWQWHSRWLHRVICSLLGRKYLFSPSRAPCGTFNTQNKTGSRKGGSSIVTVTVNRQGQNISQMVAQIHVKVQVWSSDVVHGAYLALNKCEPLF